MGFRSCIFLDLFFFSTRIVAGITRRFDLDVILKRFVFSWNLSNINEIESGRLVNFGLVWWIDHSLSLFVHTLVSWLSQRVIWSRNLRFDLVHFFEFVHFHDRVENGPLTDQLVFRPLTHGGCPSQRLCCGREMAHPRLLAFSWLVLIRT